MWPEDEDAIRRHILRHFPYTVFYEVQGNTVTISPLRTGAAGEDTGANANEVKRSALRSNWEWRIGEIRGFRSRSSNPLRRRLSLPKPLKHISAHPLREFFLAVEIDADGVLAQHARFFVAVRAQQHFDGRGERSTS